MDYNKLFTSKIRTKRMRKRRFIGLIFVALLLFVPIQTNAYAGTQNITVGIAKILYAPFQLPFNIVRDSTGTPLGPIGGILSGALKMTMSIVSGVVDIATGVAPLAKYGLFFV